MKRILYFVIATMMILSYTNNVFAASKEEIASADTLYKLGIIDSTGFDSNGNNIYNLEYKPTYNEAVALINDLNIVSIPFEITSNGNEKIKTSQYLSIILSVLGYEKGIDFDPDKPWELSDAIGLTSGQYKSDNNEFDKGDIVIITEKALSTKLKDSNVMLMRKIFNQKSADKWEEVRRNTHVSSLGLPEAIGMTTLSYDDARALLGKEPEIIADKVKTVGDVAQYMISSNFGGYTHGVFTPWYSNGAENWGFDPPGNEQLRQNYGTCCAGYANMALYLLKGDYEESGVIRWLGGGNHTIAYVRTGDKYYVFDPTEFCNGNSTPVTVLNRLEDYYNNIPSNYPKAEMINIVAIKGVDINYPASGRWDHGELIFPTEAKGKVIQLYRKNSLARVSFKDVRVDIPMWNTNKLDIPATNTKYDTYEELKKEYLKREYFKKDITLVFDNGFTAKENCGFGVGVGSSFKISVKADGDTISNYTVKSSNPAVCDVYTDSNGMLNLVTKKLGNCTIYLTYNGEIEEFYYHSVP